MQDYRFLATVNLPQFKLREHVMDWQYEERRRAQKILPFLHLGPAAAARDRGFLQASAITMTLAVHDVDLNAMQAIIRPKVPRELGLETATVKIEGRHAFIPAFKQVIAIINNHLAPRYQSWDDKAAQPLPGAVLVFCESGNEKSAAAVAAYIMAMFSMDLVRALQVVQSRRFCVSVDDGMRHLLQAFQDVIEAQNQVNALRFQEHGVVAGPEKGESVAESLQALSTTHAKRSIDQAYEDDEMQVETVEEGLAEKRAGVAPFTESSTG